MLLSPSTAEDLHTVTPNRGATSIQQYQILTINVEDYFQVGVFHRFIDPRHWYRFTSRLEKNIEQTLQLLSESQTTATFFVLGWIAEKHPELVRRISDAGHEVASRGYLHQSLLTLERSERSEDLTRSRHLLEDITGRPVYGFRLSDGWLGQRSLSFLDEIQEAGYLYDSSLMPRRREFRQEPHRRIIHSHQCRTGTLMEIPPSTLSFAGSWLPIAGGNYQRQLPDSIMRPAVSRWIQTEKSPFVMYLQIWELDQDQPRLSVASRLTRMRHYRNLDKYQWLLPEYLRTWKFTSVIEHAALPESPLNGLQKEIENSDSGRAAESPSYKAAERVKIESVERDSGTCTFSVVPTSIPETSIRRLHNGQTPITLIVPCYNEEGSLPYLARTLEHLDHALAPNWELRCIFVDDCSRDNTHEVLKALFGADSRRQIVRHEVNRGVSAAILTGLNASSSEINCSIDCDCSYDPMELPRMLQLMKPGIAMVTASPYHPNGEVKNVPRWRLFLSQGLSVLYRILLGRTLSTWTSCFRIYRRSMILDLPLRESGFLGTAELAGQLSLHDRPVIEYPATLDVRLFGVSKMKTIRTIMSHLKLLGRLTVQRFAHLTRFARVDRR